MAKFVIYKKGYLIHCCSYLRKQLPIDALHMYALILNSLFDKTIFLIYHQLSP